MVLTGKAAVIAQVDTVLEGSRLGARAREKRDLSDTIRSAALELFLREGFDETTVAEIASLAGVTSRTFFRHFPTKETVILDVLDQTSTDLIAMINRKDEQAVLATLKSSYAEWFTRYDSLFSALGMVISASPSLEAATLRRQVYWESELQIRIAQQFSELTYTQTAIWAKLAYAMSRLSQEHASRNDSSLRDAALYIFGILETQLLPD